MWRRKNGWGLQMESNDILCVVASTGGGGAERVASSLVSEWASEGKSVVVATFERHPREFSIDAKVLCLNKGHSSHVWIKIVRLFQRVGFLTKIIRNSRPARIVSFTEGPNLVALLAATLAGRLGSLTISVHADPKFWSPEHRPLSRVLYPLAPRIVVCAEGIKQYILESIRIRPERIKVIRNPLPKTISQDDGLSIDFGSSRFILGVGRLGLEKGFDLLLRAYAASGISSSHQLRIVGEGAQEPALKSLSADLNISERVVFHGWRNDVSEFYRRADLLVVPSRTEAFGNVIIEAMESGCPVVAFDCDYGPREIISDGVNGALVPPGDVEALGRKIHELISGGPQALNSLSAAGRERARDFDVRKIAAQWLGLLGFSSRQG